MKKLVYYERRNCDLRILRLLNSVTKKGSLLDFLNDGNFFTDGEWKFQRQDSNHEFNTKSLCKFVETVLDKEPSDRLIPILSQAVSIGSVLDLQDILQQFYFDIYKIAFGYDPTYLLPLLLEEKFAVAFDEATKLSVQRYSSLVPMLWKINRVFCIGLEKNLAIVVFKVGKFSKSIIREKKRELTQNSSIESVDLLLRRYYSYPLFCSASSLEYRHHSQSCSSWYYFFPRIPNSSWLESVDLQRVGSLAG